MNELWQIELFGWLRATHNEQVVSRFRTRKAEALLAFLAFHTHRSHPRDQLIELLWPGCVPADGRRTLRVELTYLRRQLEPPNVPRGAVLITTRTSIQLNPVTCVTDVAQFEAALQAAKRAAGPEERVQQLLTAAQLHRGELLPGCFDNWILPERQRLAEAFITAVHELAQLLEQSGDRPEALQWARRAVAADPLCPESRQLLIQLLLANGQIEAARAQYEEAQPLLLRELGIGLSAGNLPSLHGSAAREERLLAPPAQQQDKSRRPSWQRKTWELLPADPAANRSGGTGTEPGASGPSSRAVAHPTGSLPVYLSRFFGREREITQLRTLLCSVDEQARADNGTATAAPHLPLSVPRSCRLLTLTGPGGIGKTRLALQAAQSLRHAFPGGVWFVPLRELTDFAAIPAEMLRSLRLSCTSLGEALEPVVAFLSVRCAGAGTAMLMLDNFEHLVEGGAEIVQSLLAQVEWLTVLVTSRQPLAINGERTLPVGPLLFPGVQARGYSGASADAQRPSEHLRSLTPESLMLYPSVQLFVDRAQAVQPDFQVTTRNAAAVAGLCQRLEGLPLAIELAAARSGVLTPQQMLAQMVQRFELLVRRQRSTDPRHHSLRAALDWSYRLLTPVLQRFFACLSVFRGGCTVNAAEAICVEAIQSQGQACRETTGLLTCLDLLEQLRQASLVQAAETGGAMRFSLLESLREYGAEQLAESEREILARRHAEFFLTLAENAAPELARGDQRPWLDHLEIEHDNLRAVLAWSIQHEELAIGLRMAHALEEFWQLRGYLTEARDQFLHLLALPGAAAPIAERAGALRGAGRFTGLRGDLESARSQLEESLTIWRELRDQAGVAATLQYLGDVGRHRSDLVTARGAIEESLAIRRDLGDRRGVADALLTLGWVVRAQGDLASARAVVAESLAISRELNDQVKIISALDGLGSMAFFDKDLETAASLFTEALAAARKLNDRTHIAWGLAHLGWVAQEQEEFAAARAHYEQCLTMMRELDLGSGLMDTLFLLGWTLRRQGNYATAHEAFSETLAISRERRWSQSIAASLCMLGAVAADAGRWSQAASNCTESLLLYREGEWRHHWLGVGCCLDGLARVALVRGRPGRAARLLGATAALWAAHDRPEWHIERRWHLQLDQDVAAVRANLAEAEFAAAWAAGQAMLLEEVISEALKEAPAGQLQHS
jgi:predicted ATPase/DNA-binding SARP family transcriptional activator